MARRSASSSFLQRFQRKPHEVAEFPDVVTAPSPGGPVPIPYPNTGKGEPKPTARDDGQRDVSDEAPKSPIGQETVQADPSPTAFDEADALFGKRTEVPPPKEVAPADDGHAESGVSDASAQLGDPVMATTSFQDPEEMLDDFADPEEMLDDFTAEATAPPSGIVTPNNVIGPSNFQDPEEMLDDFADPEEVLEDIVDPDDDLLLVEQPTGSIAEQLASTVSFSMHEVSVEALDNVEGVEDLDVDDD